MSELVLAHYDPKLPLQLVGDASAYGTGAMNSHTFQMAQSSQLLTHLGCSLKVKKIMLNSKRRLVPWCLEFASFISICMVESLPCTLTTNH